MYIYHESCSSLAGDLDDVQQAVDMSFLFPQLSASEWASLWTSVEENEDATSAALMVKTIANFSFIT